MKLDQFAPVEDFLRSINVEVSGEVKKNLQTEEVDIDALKGLTDEQLKQLGFTMGGRSKILQANKRF